MFPFKGLFQPKPNHLLPPNAAATHIPHQHQQQIHDTGHHTPPPPPIVPNAQWPLNKADYQDLANDQVDWAALAQQWIHMKETCTTDEMLAAPPPPVISSGGGTNHSRSLPTSRMHEEKGEAPMEMDRDDDDTAPPTTTTHHNPFMGAPSVAAVLPPLHQPPPNWHHQHSAAAAGAPPPLWQQAPPPPATNAAPWNKKPGWNTWTNPNLPAIPPPLRPPHFIPAVGGPAQLIVDPAAHIQPTADRIWPRHSSRHPAATEFQHNSGSNSPTIEMAPHLPVALDAAKRKTLPTWIRLGLEKMEREKQKSIEQDERDRLNRLKQEQQKQELLAIAADVTLGSKSKFDSDTDGSSDEDHDGAPKGILLAPEPKRVLPKKSRQEQLQDLMLLVRSSLTEILLEVTNDELRSIATDTLSKMRLKARTAQTVKKTALTSLTGGLGLGIYADSDASDDDDASGGDDDDSRNGSDANGGDESEAELKESIKRRKKEFEDRTKEIEAQLAAEADRERRWLEADPSASKATTDDQPQHRTDSSAASVASAMSAGHAKLVAKNQRRTSHANDNDIGEVHQHDQKFNQSHARPSERKTSRFSDPKDTVKNVQLTHGSIIYENPLAKPNPIAAKPNATPASVHHSDSDAASVTSTTRAHSIKSSSSSRRHDRHAPSSRHRTHDDSDDGYPKHDRRNRDRKVHKRDRSRSSSSSSASSSDRSTRHRADAASHHKSSNKHRRSRDRQLAARSSRHRSGSRERSAAASSKRKQRRSSRSRSPRSRAQQRY